MISPTLTAEALFWQASLQAAQPIQQASSLTKAALVAAGRTLVLDIDTALKAAGKPLDADDPTGMGPNLVTALLDLSAAADDQGKLAKIRGTVGRAVFNLAQV